MSGLGGKVCVITGAATGMGRATAVEMARQGARGVVVSDVNDGEGAETVRLVRDAGGEALYVRCDVRREADVAALVAAAVERFGSLDVLHNNAAAHEAAIAGPQPVDAISNELWDIVYETNLRGYFWTTKHAAPHLRRSPGGAIVNAGSTAGLVGYPGSPAYNAMKGAIVQLTRSTAVDLAPVRCNCYCPAGVDTPLLDAFLAGSPDPGAIRRALVDNYLVKRLGTPEDIAKLVCFLASDDASWITGAVISIDGGALSWRAL
jgi:NAD(P)-dependent dehydrogenase (short-subunit alcohol dehydrogenase family)